MKNRLYLLLSISMFMFTSCKNNESSQVVETITTGEVGVIHETSFNSIYAKITIKQFMNLGFEFGDSVNVSFSNGAYLEDIPYYDGYYTKIGMPLVVGYPGYPYIDIATNNRDQFWQSLNLTEDDTACISLNEKDKYIVQQQTFSTTYYDDRSLYSTDEVFSNFRSMNLSTMNESAFYRGASPVDNQHKRAANSDKLIKQANIGYILDLADSEEEFQEYIEKDDFNSPYALNLYQNNKISLLDMGADFTSEIFQNKLVTGLEALIKQTGPYYIHCTEGKDRTGFVCFFLEALSGANYDELEADYMITYDNYYGITKENDPSKYQAIVDLRFKDFVSHLMSYAETEATSYKDAAISYLLDGNMSSNDIDTLISIISK